jgi:saccharopine dehydrogenase-like NADP-dependent oxidoreductase
MDGNANISRHEIGERMKVLLLGVGMQGSVALDDLMCSDAVAEVVAADQDLEALLLRARTMGYGDRLRCEQLDAADQASLDRLFALGPDVAIDLLPVDFIPAVAECAIRHGVHLVNTFYVPESLRALAPAAEAAGVAILPEFGMDPGIDLVLLGETVRAMDEVYEIHSYGGGIPAPEASYNAIRYKISWTFEGVLRSYYHPGKLIRQGQEVRLKADELFAPANGHEIEIDGLGTMEAFANGDAVQYCEPLGIDVSTLRAAGRYSLRWPGHCAFWKKLVDLHLLDNEPVIMGDQSVDRQAYLVAALEPHLRYEGDEPDLGIIRLDVVGRLDGVDRTVTHLVVDRRNPDTGFTAMGRLVGFTASIGAQMLAAGEIGGKGLLSPVRAVPHARFLSELERRGVEVTTVEY